MFDFDIPDEKKLALGKEMMKRWDVQEEKFELTNHERIAISAVVGQATDYTRKLYDVWKLDERLLFCVTERLAWFFEAVVKQLPDEYRTPINEKEEL